MSVIRRDVWLEMVADYLSREDRFTTDATVPHGESTVKGLRRAANDYRGAVKDADRLRAVLRAVLMEPDPIKRNQLAAPVLTTNGEQ